LGEKISVTIIATGFQTREEREVEKSQVRKVSILTPEQAPLVKVVQENSFIEFKNEDINVPVLKSKEESQVDLFAGYFQSAPKVEEEKVEDANLIRHALNEEVSIDQEVELIEPSFDFEIKTEEVESEIEPTYELDEEDVPEYVFNPDENKTDESIEEQLRKSKERILRLKDLSMKLRTTNGLQELENEPAYKRKQMSLPDLPHSSESQVSRFTLSVDEGITEIKPNNSFLHDNVD
jgi:cell division protein FtsZ